MAHDFEKYPELTNSQLDIYYFESPHPQIFETFNAEVVKVHDGDTITVKWYNRNFPFPIRLSDINAPELSHKDGPASQKWLEQRLLRKRVSVVVDPRNRVGKFGRLLGRIIADGVNISEEAISLNYAVPFNHKKEGLIPTIEQILAKV